MVLQRQVYQRKGGPRSIANWLCFYLSKLYEEAVTSNQHAKVYAAQFEADAAIRKHGDGTLHGVQWNGHLFQPRRRQSWKEGPVASVAIKIQGSLPLIADQ